MEFVSFAGVELFFCLFFTFFGLESLAAAAGSPRDLQPWSYAKHLAACNEQLPTPPSAFHVPGN